MVTELLVSQQSLSRILTDNVHEGPHHCCSLRHSQLITCIQVKQPVQHASSVIHMKQLFLGGFLNTSGFVFAASSLFKRCDYFRVSWKMRLLLKSEKTWLWTSHVINALVVRTATCWQVAIPNTWAWIVRDTWSLLRCCSFHGVANLSDGHGAITWELWLPGV